MAVDPKAEIRYEYDANGNRRRVRSYYHDGVDGSMQVQDYWYTYDGMNRVTVSKGRLQGARGSGIIDAGPNGYAIEYYRTGLRRSVSYTENGAAVKESYIYEGDGQLVTTSINDLPRTQRAYDPIGNVATYSEFQTDGIGVMRNLIRSYDADSRLLTENNGISTSTYWYDRNGDLGRIVAPAATSTTPATSPNGSESRSTCSTMRAAVATR